MRTDIADSLGVPDPVPLVSISPGDPLGFTATRDAPARDEPVAPSQKPQPQPAHRASVLTPAVERVLAWHQRHGI